MARDPEDRILIRRLARIAAALSLVCALPAMAQQAPAAGQPPAEATPQIEISQGVRASLPIAIASFTGTGQHGEEIAGIIRNNLGRSGAFDAIDPARFVERGADGASVPNFANWKLIQAQYLVTGVTTTDPDGRVRVDFRLWDVGQGQQLVGLQFVAPAENWRRVGHKISDAVYQRLTGESGYFDTRIAFVAESGPRTARKRVLGLMDQDGWNPQVFDRGAEMIFSPRFSSSTQELTYMALRDEGSQIYLWNLDTNRRETLGKFAGMAFAPRFNRNGDRIAFSLERGGNSDIVVMNLRSRSQSKLTSDPGIDTSPSFSPDDSQIVFNSDRAGSPQLYLMTSDGSNQRRLSRGGGRYTDPVWSPRGDFIAFTKQTGGEFHIGVMRPDGSDERILTTSFLDEGPTWAPNGRVLMFFRETSGGEPRLWTVDLNGRAQPAQYSGSASDPAWSPLLE